MPHLTPDFSKNSGSTHLSLDLKSQSQMKCYKRLKIHQTYMKGLSYSELLEADQCSEIFKVKFLEDTSPLKNCTLENGEHR